ncbi:MAG: shikimate kinase [Ruminococcus sp.]|nr:shikimate kinase [Ruminococcus sp.]
MPGVGKSTAGVILAKILGYRFIDTDLLIQESENRLLHEIISAEGVDGFIKIENRVNCRINARRAVIATGGSIVYSHEAMKHLSDIGTVVYLKLDYQKLKYRLRNIKNRGVVIRKGQRMLELYKERTPLYERYADIIIDENGCGIEKTVSLIIESLNSVL